MYHKFARFEDSVGGDSDLFGAQVSATRDQVADRGRNITQQSLWIEPSAVCFKRQMIPFTFHVTLKIKRFG